MRWSATWTREVEKRFQSKRLVAMQNYKKKKELYNECLKCNKLGKTPGRCRNVMIISIMCSSSTAHISHESWLNLLIVSHTRVRLEWKFNIHGAKDLKSTIETRNSQQSFSTLWRSEGVRSCATLAAWKDEATRVSSRKRQTGSNWLFSCTGEFGRGRSADKKRAATLTRSPHK
jgi:hypothetical protein